MRLELDGIEVRADEWSERCQTVVEAVGGYVVAVSSVFQGRAVTVVSCYLADLAGPVAVSHLRLAPGRAPEVSQRVLESLAGVSHARACLLDHAAVLRDALDDLLAEEEEVGVEVDEVALERASSVWDRGRG